MLKRISIAFVLLASLAFAQRSDSLLPDAPGDSIRFQIVYAVTTSLVNQCLAPDATTRDCFVNYLHVANTTGASISVTVTDLAGNVFWAALPIPANGVATESFNGGAKFTGGLKISASATGTTAWIRGARGR